VTSDADILAVTFFSIQTLRVAFNSKNYASARLFGDLQSFAAITNDKCGTRVIVVLTIPAASCGNTACRRAIGFTPAVE
jgi:hypothetical protein